MESLDSKTEPNLLEFEEWKSSTSCFNEAGVPSLVSEEEASDRLGLALGLSKWPIGSQSSD